MNPQAAKVDFLAFLCYYLAMMTKEVIVIDPRGLRDVDLLDYSVSFGRLALKARNRFIGSLPEVARRGLYFKKGFESIFHFAKMTGGVSEEQVKTVMSLARQFSRLPHLILLLLTGQVSINKLIRVASVANSENEEFWANQVQVLSKRALETLVRDYKRAQIDDVTAPRDREDPLEFTPLPEVLNPSNPLPGQKVAQQKISIVKADEVPQSSELLLADDVRAQLLELQNNGIDINVELREFLTRRKANIAKEKDQFANLADARALVGEGGRAVPAQTERLLEKEYGVRCAQPGCTKKSVEIHHTNRYAMSKSHNPYYLAPLCKQHHQIAHSIDVKVTEKRQH